MVTNEASRIPTNNKRNYDHNQLNDASISAEKCPTYCAKIGCPRSKKEALFSILINAGILAFESQAFSYFASSFHISLSLLL